MPLSKAERLARLKPWPKGVSGNPSGKPKATIGAAAVTRAEQAEERERRRSKASQCQA